MTSPRRLAFLTPTFAGDLERFALLRRSMRAVGVEVPHVAVVHTEDAPRFAAHFRSEAGLTLVTTAEVLPPEVERARRRGSGRRPRTPRALVARALQELPAWTLTTSGWRAQQLTKLYAGEALGLDEWVCLDSDTVFLAPVSSADFHDGDRLVLHRLWSPGEQEPQTRRASAHLLGLDPVGLDRSTYYVDQVVPFDRLVVDGLIAHVGARHGTAFAKAFLRSRATEFMSYGLYADHFDSTRRLSPRQLALVHHVYRYDGDTFTRDLGAALDMGRRLVMVHSMLGVDPSVIERDVAPLWRRAAD